MRGNSRCDPVLSISAIENRILINTEYNVLLMEFENIQYEYGTNKDESNEASLADKYELMKKTKNYPSIRASRMELVATPNVKLFNDDRKSVLEHSSRPISAKNLQDAKIVHNITSKPTNLTKNSTGNFSEYALQKRQSIVQAINETIISRTSLSVLSNQRGTSLSHTNPHHIHHYFDGNLESSREIQSKDFLDSSRTKFSSLRETKLFLRDQLNEMKQAEQRKPDDQKSKHKTKDIETESCVETRIVNRDEITGRYRSYEEIIVRPTSSPSRVDTRTKTKLKPYDLIKWHQEQESSNLDFDNTAKKHEHRPRTTATTATTAIKLESRSLQQLRPNQTQKFITKVFETQEAHSKTNLNMHPINVKTKIPNPKIVNLIRPQTTVSDKKENVVKLARGNTATTRVTEASGSTKVQRSKSAHPMNQTNQNLIENSLNTPFLIRPKSHVNNLPPKTPKPLNTELSEQTNRLSSHNDLNLMTFKQVDRIIDTINGYLVSPEKTRELQEAELFKKIWMLKGKGQYHGSLLAKPKTVAPEIRE